MAANLLSPVSEDGFVYCSSCSSPAESADDAFETLDLPDSYYLPEYLSDDLDYNTLPFVKKFKHSLSPGATFFIEGSVLDNATKFTINFWHGEDIAFHFNPRMDQNYIARNSFISSHWLQEEKQLPRKNPFKRGKPFLLEIFVAPHEFMVSVNGIHICNYRHRVSVESINGIVIKGDIDLKKVLITKQRTYPTSCLSTDGRQAVEDNSRLSLPNGLVPGDQVRLSGRVMLLPHSFSISVLCSQFLWPPPPVPLKLDVLFFEERIEVKKWSEKLGDWLVPLTSPLKGFRPGSHFALTLLFTKAHLELWVEGDMLATLPYIEEFAHAALLAVEGDVKVHSLTVQHKTGLS